MNLLKKTDDEIVKIANPIWENLIRSSNNKDYGSFTKDFSSQMLYGANEVELGKQWANNKLLTSLKPRNLFPTLISDAPYDHYVPKNPPLVVFLCSGP